MKIFVLNKRRLLSDEQMHKKVILLSFVSSILVVLIHAYWVFTQASLDYSSLNNTAIKIAYWINRLGNSFAVQFFFLLSGFLLFYNITSNNVLRKYKSRFISLVIPYVLWNIFYLVFWMIAKMSGWSDIEIDYNLLHLIKDIILHKYFQTYWFMFDLIIFVALSPLLYVLKKSRIGLLSFDLIILFLYVYQTCNPLSYFATYFGVYWFLWFTIGVNLGVFFPDFMRCEITLGGIRAFLGLVVISGVCFAIRSYECIFTFVSIILIAYIIVVICGLIDWESFGVRNIMKKSFVIYSWHGMVCTFLSKIAMRMLPDTYYSEVIAYLSYVLLGLALICILDEVAKRTIPKIRSSFLGGRDK